MSLESSLFTFITGDPAVGPLIGGTRMYPRKLPQSPQMPSVVYNRISSGQEYELEGDEVDVRPARFQFDCWDDGYAGALALAAAVRARLSGYSGVVGADMVQTILIEDEMDMYEPETELWRRMVEAVIWYE